MRDRHLDRMRPAPRQRLAPPRRRCPRAVRACTGPGRSSSARGTRRAPSSGSWPALTIWRASLGQRLHRRDHVDDLEARLPAAHDPLLAGDHDHRHRAEMRIGRAGGEVQRAGAERRDAHAGLARQPPVVAAMKAAACSWRVRTSSIFEVRSDSTTIEIFFARHAEDAVDALILERCDKQVRSLHLALLPTHIASRSLLAPVFRERHIVTVCGAGTTHNAAWSVERNARSVILRREFGSASRR